ncbi:4-oxalocrotonate tautomerase family protein [Clostridium sp. M62/1]|uniref:tautomerase family protein n=1 Tax=Clostridium sp. M62/1 TaxID=411486 RepID=UPI00019739DF|nr:tautomerase family protein [Clostridium sp. M62/1]EFE14563.1 tautomerase enzyme [Clostridium sp. M62/1]UEB77958.1 4-oxalocrotonate tautomerase family protein [Clostridium sp. M62/1]
MPHVDITMIPGRDDTAKKEIALKVQQFLAKELNIDEKFVSVSIEDFPKEEWDDHMERLKDKKMFVEPGV